MLHSVVNRIQYILILSLKGKVVILLDLSYQRRKGVPGEKKKHESNHENCVTACHMGMT